MNRRWVAIAAARLVVTLAIVVGVVCAVHVPAARAADAFLSIPDRADVAYDDARSVLYISAGDRIERYKPDTGEMLSPIVLGGQLAGMDISPDGNTLAVADTMLAGIHTVDLVTDATSTIVFPGSPAGAGTWEIAYADDGRLLASGTGVTLWRYDPITGLAPEFPSLEWNQNHFTGPKEHLAASADRSTIGIVSTDNFGHWSEYSSDSDTLIEHSTGWGWTAWDVSGNSDGSQFAICTNSNIALVSPGSDDYTLLDAAVPFGAKFSPSTSSVFAPTYDSSQMLEYDADDGSVLSTYDLGRQIGWNYDGVFYWPRMAVAQDNSLVFCTVPGGVQVVHVHPRITGTLTSAASWAGIPHSRIEVYRQMAGGWQLETTVTVDPSGFWKYLSSDTTPVKLRAVDPSGMHDPVWYGGSDLASAQEVTLGYGLDSVDIEMPLTHPARIHGKATTFFDGTPVPDVEVVLLTPDGEDVVDFATTGADGTYSFSSVPPGDYNVFFIGPDGVYEPRYWEVPSSPGDPGVIDISSPADFLADVTLDPPWVDLEFGPTELAPGASLYPVSGTPVGISTSLLDSDSGDPVSKRQLVVESSTDEVTWAVDRGAAAHETSSGVYEATVTPTGSMPISYRFTVADDSSYVGFYSDSVELIPHVAAPFFSRPNVGDSFDDPVPPGQSTGLVVQLRNPDGSLLSGRQLQVMDSDDGVNYRSTSIPVSQIATGTYQATFYPARSAWFKFLLPGAGTIPLAVSAGTRVSVDSVGNTSWSACTFDLWGPTTALIGQSDAGVRETLRSRLATVPPGGLASDLASSSVRLQSSPDGIVFTDVPTTAASPIAWDPFGRSASALVGPLGKTYYRFVYAGDDERDPSASSAALIVPRPILSKPNAPTRTRRNRSFIISGSVYPQHLPGYRVQVEIRRWVRKRWRLYHTYTASTSPGGGYSRYRLAIKLSKAGSYRAVTVVAADADHVARTSKTVTVVVR